MPKIALDPTPFHHDLSLLEFPRKVADLGYEYLQLTPHRDFIPFYRHPKADDDLVDAFAAACRDAGVQVASVLPVLRWSGPDRDAREAAVTKWKRVIEITKRLGVDTINTEFSGRPERAEESEDAFYRSMEELLPIIESSDLRVLIDPHPDDFVEDGLEALRVIRGLNSKHVGFVYVACHTFHYGGNMDAIMDAAGDSLQLVHVADAFDHTRSHGLRYISNPPGNTARCTSTCRSVRPTSTSTRSGPASPASGSPTATTRSRCPASSPRTRTPTRCPASSWTRSRRD